MSRQQMELGTLLSGGDLRSIGAADLAVRGLLNGKWQPNEIVDLIGDATPVVRMRAADALEKASRSSPNLVQEIGGRLLSLLVAEQPKEVRWHLLQMAPRIHWSAAEAKTLLGCVERAFADPSAIVQTSALQALAELAAQRQEFARAFAVRLASSATSKFPSVRARARKLLAVMDRNAPLDPLASGGRRLAAADYRRRSAARG